MPSTTTKITLDLSDADLTRYLSNATGATWTLTETTSTDGLAHTVTIHNDSVTDHHLKTAILTGTDANGIAQTETVSLPNTSATVTSTKHFKTLTSVVPSATIGADTMDIGMGAVTVSQWVRLAKYNEVFNVGFWLAVTGTINVTVEHSPNDTYPPTMVIADATLAAKTADSYGSLTVPALYSRLKVNSFSTTAEITFSVVQQGGN